MSSYHQAAYAAVNVPREAIPERIFPLLDTHGVQFLGEVRRFTWSERHREYVPDVDNEIDELTCLSDAWSAAAGWPSACFDVRFLQWALEMYVFEAAPSPGRVGLCFSFPNSLYKFCADDREIAARWLALLVAAGTALDAAAMLCGPDVRCGWYREDELLDDLKRFLRTYEKGVLAMHTALVRDAQVETPVWETARRLGFLSGAVGEGYTLLSLIQVDWERLRTEAAPA